MDMRSLYQCKLRGDKMITDGRLNTRNPELTTSNVLWRAAMSIWDLFALASLLDLMNLLVRLTASQHP
jgi:hypothetical protein